LAKSDGPRMPGDSLTSSLDFSQDQKIRLYKWDGKAFREEGLLQSNQGLVSALAFSPDGSKLAAGDVSVFPPPPLVLGAFRVR
jgi:WD40 repeat protein